MTLIPHPYQHRAIEFSLDVPASFQMMDLGMGKTMVALNVISRLKIPAIVFAPLTNIYSSWPAEIKKWAPHLSYYILHGPRKSLYGLEKCDIILTNYETIPWLAKQKTYWVKRMPIFDESSKMKSHSTQRFRLMQKSGPLWLPYRMNMSATPKPNSTHELWSQYYLLDGGKLLEKNITRFRDKYCKAISWPGMTHTEYVVRDEMIQPIYDKVAPITYRLDAADYLDMPEITYNYIPIEMPDKLKKRYKTFEERSVDPVTGIEAPNAASLANKLRQFTQGGLYNEEKQWIQIHDLKVRALEDLVESSVSPILCAIQYKGELEVLRKVFGAHIPVIAGGTSPKKALGYIESWNRGEIPLLLCHPGSLSHGLNLQSGGHTLLWYAPTWSLEQYLQLNGRLYRQGQKSHVIIHHFILQDSIDIAVMEALNNKNFSQEEFLNYVKSYRS